MHYAQNGRPRPCSPAKTPRRVRAPARPQFGDR